MYLRWPFRRQATQRDVLVLDDFFPNLLTGFRVAEYNAYLEAIPRLRVLSSLPDFSKQIAHYAALYPRLAPRVQRYRRSELASAGFAYLNFLNNADRFLPDLQRANLPFAITLYPGGGFGLNEADSDAKLSRILASPNLQSITVTQAVTRDYVRAFAARHALRTVPIHEITGVVVNPLYFQDRTASHGPYYGEGKPKFDVCFVAERYMDRGENKGFPAFMALAREYRGAENMKFHVVGGFGPVDLSDGERDLSIRFHGRLETSELRRFLHDIDLVVSPNRPFVLHPGNFDGFPTGGCVEASLCGAALMATDALQQNPGYVDRESMLIVGPRAEDLVQAMRWLLDEPARVAKLARAGRELSLQLYAPNVQIGRRIALLEESAGAAGLDLR